MRTTLTLDDDVAAGIERLRRDRDASLKDIVNDALRRGLRDMAAPPKPRKPFRTQPIDGATPALHSMDNIAEVLAIAEGEFFK
jgi:hypothetical protein